MFFETIVIIKVKVGSCFLRTTGRLESMVGRDDSVTTFSIESSYKGIITRCGLVV